MKVACVCVRVCVFGLKWILFSCCVGQTSADHKCDWATNFNGLVANLFCLCCWAVANLPLGSSVVCESSWVSLGKLWRWRSHKRTTSLHWKWLKWDSKMWLCWGNGSSHDCFFFCFVFFNQIIWVSSVSYPSSISQNINPEPHGILLHSFWASCFESKYVTSIVLIIII